MDHSNDGREADVKICTCCLTSKTLDCYNKCKGQVDGLQRYCKSCQSAKNKAWMKEKKEHRREYATRYADENQHRRKAKKREWDAANAEHRKNYRLNRKAYYAERASARRAATLMAMPSWLTEDQLKSIQEKYWLAKDAYVTSGEEYHVDHIVPLQGKNVCGLHVPWNLQVIPADVNYSKNNIFKEHEWVT